MCVVQQQHAQVTQKTQDEKVFPSQFTFFRGGMFI